MSAKWLSLNDVMSFGKHQGRDVNSVCIIDPAYLMWVHCNKKINTYFTNDVWNKAGERPKRDQPTRENKESRVVKHARMNVDHIR